MKMFAVKEFKYYAKVPRHMSIMNTTRSNSESLEPLLAP